MTKSQNSLNLCCDSCCGEKGVCILDKFPISNRDILVLSIEDTNSEYIQGIALGVYGSFEMMGKRYKKGELTHMALWEDTKMCNPKCVEIQVFTERDFVFIKNIWRKKPSSSLFLEPKDWKEMNEKNGAAMYCKNVENGRRFFCNDGEEDEDFVDLVFTVVRKRMDCSL